MSRPFSPRSSGFSGPFVRVYRYEQSKKEKEAKKHHHANKVKEIQLSPSISPHDFGVKLSHGVDFLCDEMKVKLALRFRGREMAHQEIGFQVVKKFIQALALYGHPDAEPKLIGRGIHVMLSPLPRNKRAKNPNQFGDGVPPAGGSSENGDDSAKRETNPQNSKVVPTNASEKQSAGFANNPFTQLDAKLGDA